jgi:hypothetical protein
MALLGVLVLCIFPFSISIEQAHAQSAQIDNARTALVQAFVLVQEADLQGASVGQISQLADSLNLALHYEENATRLWPLRRPVFAVVQCYCSSGHRRL